MQVLTKVYRNYLTYFFNNKVKKFGEKNNIIVHGLQK